MNVCNVGPPKKDDGQSGLQVAFKTGNFEVAKLLIDKGANVNFMETSKINEWTAPVLHDCIRATILNSYTLQRDTKRFDSNPSADLTSGVLFQQLRRVMKALIAAGADLNSSSEQRPSALSMATKFKLEQYELF